MQLKHNFSKRFFSSLVYKKNIFLTSFSTAIVRIYILHSNTSLFTWWLLLFEIKKYFSLFRLYMLFNYKINVLRNNKNILSIYKFFKK